MFLKNMKMFCKLGHVTFFIRIFNISPCVFIQISNGWAYWMQNLIPHPTRPLAQNLSKNTGGYVENTNKKGSFLL